MANTYSATVLQEARVWQLEEMARKFEQRRNLSNVTAMYIAGQSNIPDIERIKQAETQATKIAYLKKMSFTDGNAKTCSPSGDVGGTGLQTATWLTKTRKIKVPKSQFIGNELAEVRFLADALYQMELDFFFGANGMDSLMLAHLEANRTQVNAISGGGGINTWVGAADFNVTVANSAKDRFYNSLMAEMALNNYAGTMWDVHNTSWMYDVAYYSQQGTANSVNTAFQFDGFVRTPSNLLTNAAGAYSTHYIVPEGGVAMATWNAPLNRMGEGRGDRERSVYQSKIFPKIYFDVYILHSCADTSADGGSVQDEVRQLEFALNYTLLTQPISVANETPIFKYKVLVP